MPILIIDHEVEDFARWKPKFDAHRRSRERAGLQDLHVLRDAQQPNQVTIICRADDLQRAKEFGESADLREAMKGAGVVGAPLVRFLNEA